LSEAQSEDREERSQRDGCGRRGAAGGAGRDVVDRLRALCASFCLCARKRLSPWSPVTLWARHPLGSRDVLSPCASTTTCA